MAYTPLEQYGGDTGFTDARSDIYSLGATLYHLLSGQPPADAKERFLRPGVLTSLRQLNPAVSARVERAIFQALAMHPNERPPNAPALRGYLFGSTPLPSQLAPHLSPPPTPSWREILQYNQRLIFQQQSYSYWRSFSAYNGSLCVASYVTKSR